MNHNLVEKFSSKLCFTGVLWESQALMRKNRVFAGRNSDKISDFPPNPEFSVGETGETVQIRSLGVCHGLSPSQVRNQITLVFFKK